jgi:riboflavin synthase
MFTGLIEEKGRVEAVAETGEGRRLRIRAETAGADLRPGDSIAVNGVCQTVVRSLDRNEFEVVAVPETLARTTLAALRPGNPVNLERPLRVGDRLGGHWVNGHVDATGVIEEIRERDREHAVRVSMPPELARFVVEKGSIAVDGVSLTVGQVRESEPGCSFWVHIIPETRARTLFGSYRTGDRVNLEVDILGKYVERALAGRGIEEPSRRPSRSILEMLERWGEEESA